MTKTAAFLLVALVAGYGFHAFAQIRADVRPVVTPIGSSSSNGVSFAWFYDSVDRVVYVCRAGHGTGDSLECKVKTSLP